MCTPNQSHAAHLHMCHMSIGAGSEGENGPEARECAEADPEPGPGTMTAGIAIAIVAVRARAREARAEPGAVPEAAPAEPAVPPEEAAAELARPELNEAGSSMLSGVALLLSCCMREAARAAATAAAAAAAAADADDFTASCGGRSDGRASIAAGSAAIAAPPGIVTWSAGSGAGEPAGAAEPRCRRDAGAPGAATGGSRPSPLGVCRCGSCCCCALASVG